MNTNRFVATLVVVLSLAGFVCPVSAQTADCHIRGRVAVDALQGKNIAVLDMATGEPLAATKIKDSTFAFDIVVTKPFVAMLKTDPQNGNARSYYFLNIIAEPGDIYADLVTDSLSGTPLNDRCCQFSKHCREEVNVINAYYQQMNSEAQASSSDNEELELKASKRLDELIDYVKAAYVENKDNALGAFAMDLLLEFEGVDYESALALLEGAAPVVTNYLPLKQKLAKMERVSHTAVGKNFIDLDLTDYKTGRPTKLSKVIKDKVALIDFWASWCGPCRREIPNIAKIHEKYNSKDFVVVSLNVWDKPEAQAKAIKDLKMTWTQLTDPTRNATETYGVDGIPQILLIDKDGKIIARDLRGEEMEAAVKKALGK